MPRNLLNVLPNALVMLKFRAQISFWAPYLSGESLETTSKSTRNVDRRRIVQTMVALLVTMVCWSLSNPPGSTPDEYFTLGSIWCANGKDSKHCFEMFEGGTKTTYASGVADIDDQSCLLDVRSSIQRCDPVGLSTYVNSSGGGYPVWYYRFMNLFIPIGKSLNVLSMRLFNSFIAVGLLAIQLVLSNKQRRISLLTSFTFTLIPMSIFLTASIHPSGWALTGVANGWLFLLAATSKPRLSRSKNWLAWAAWAICAGMCLASRYDAFLFFVASTLITLLATRLTRRSFNWRVLLPISAAGIVGGYVLVQFNTIAIWALKFPIKPQSGQIENGQWVTHWLLQTIAIPVEILGTGLIGQRTLRIPDIVWIVGIALLGGVLLFSLIKTSAFQLIAFTGSLLMISFIILSFNGRLERDFFNLSGRYIIPLVPFIVGLCIYLSKSPVQLMEIRRLRIFAIVLLSLTHAIALHSVIETYVDGQSYAFLPISVGESDWWWIGLPFGPNFIVLVGALSFTKFLTLIWSTVPTVQISVNDSVGQ